MRLRFGWGWRVSDLWSVVGRQESPALFLSLVNERVMEFVIPPAAMVLGGLVSYGFGLDLSAPLASARPDRSNNVYWKKSMVAPHGARRMNHDG